VNGVAVLGIGNVLLGDDAVGPHVIAELEAGFDLDPDVLVRDAGTPGLDLVPMLEHRPAVVIVDSVKADAPPGTIKLFSKDEILAGRASIRFGPHEPALCDALASLEFSGAAPAEVVLVGIVPQTIQTGTALSPAVRAAVPAALREVVRQLARLGVGVMRRAQPRPPDVWWEAGP
jgi:hydrogenase maturation protease